MRLWHIALLPYLPDAQFKGQLRELVAIMHDWRDRGKTNHLLVNKVMAYPKEELVLYFIKYSHEWHKRYQKDISEKIYREFFAFAEAENFTAVCIQYLALMKRIRAYAWRIFLKNISSALGRQG